MTNAGRSVRLSDEALCLTLKLQDLSQIGYRLPLGGVLSPANTQNVPALLSPTHQIYHPLKHTAITGFYQSTHDTTYFHLHFFTILDLVGKHSSSTFRAQARHQFRILRTNGELKQNGRLGKERRGCRDRFRQSVYNFITELFSRCFSKANGMLTHCKTQTEDGQPDTKQPGRKTRYSTEIARARKNSSIGNEKHSGFTSDSHFSKVPPHFRFQ